MQTIDKQSSEYANSNFQHCTYHYTDDERLTDFDNIKDAFIAGVEFAQRWIPIDEELPSDNTCVLVRTMSLIRSIALFKDNFFHPDFKCIESNEVTHWRPISFS